MKRIKLILLISSLLTAGLQAQNEPEITFKDPGEDKPKKCESYFELMAQMPAEVRYTVLERDRNIFLVFSSRAHFELIFDHKADGFAIDILHQDQYRCGAPNQHANSWAHKGRLLPAMYKETFMPMIQEGSNGVMVINYGRLPDEYKPEEVEFNLLIVQKNWLCDNRYFYNLDFDTWSLLPMGLYRDSIQNPEALPYRDIQKTMEFKVPFEKDQTVFEEADVQPIRDSLNLTDYLIRTININAYSSIEGPLDRNIRLQEGRAQSIVDILKSYQNESIQSQINASENWEEFSADLKDTEFESLASLDHQVVKDRLHQDRALLDKLEPILAGHRKAEISIGLEKKVNPLTGSSDMLKQLFHESIEQKQLDQALFLQQIAFERVSSKALPESFLGELEIPESAVYGTLLTNMAVFCAESKPGNLTESVEAFAALLKILPGNPNIQYNLAVSRMRQWAMSENEINRRRMQSLVMKVERSKLPTDLIRNLKVNYHIILTKYLNDEGNYVSKNRSLRFIFNEYRKVSLEDEQLLRLAKYMTHYSRFDWAQGLLKNRVQEENVSTDVVFYYLNLTIADTRNTRRPDYQKVLDKAAERDKNRFCSLFKAKPQGGVTFQLLDDPNLKKKFCEQCSVTSTDDMEAKH